MRQTLKSLYIAALAVMGAMTLGCTSLVIPEQAGDDEQSVKKEVTLTTTITLGGDPVSKALSAAGVKTFAAGEQLAVVYKNTSNETVKAVSTALVAGDIHDEGKKADITVTLDNPAADGALCYIYPAAMAKATIATDASVDAAGTIDYTRLAAQDGTLATLSSSLDLAVYEGNLTGEATLPTSASLTNPLTIGEFTITDKDDSSTDVTGSITQLTVSDGTTTYTVNRAAAAGPIYVAMLPVTIDKTITLTAASSAHHYLKTVTGKALAANKMYPISVDMPEDMLYEPLTIVATSDYTSIEVRNVARTSSYEEGVIKYTIDGGAMQTIDYSSSSVLHVNANQIVRFYGDNATYCDGYDSSNIYVYNNCYIYGNVMSLISSTEFATTTTLTENYTFKGLFKNEFPSDLLENHPSKALVLPATTLTEDCYNEMFSGCAGLTTAPALPATTLTKNCYDEMFSGCTGLTTAPALPAMTLTNNCYHSMFDGCTSLATAPALPATTLAENCYEYMFSDCTSLTSAPALPAETMKKYCYRQMFWGCTNLSTAPALPATNLADECYSGMFAGCTGLTTAPALPATALADWCYNYMFNGCTSLTTAPDLPATTLAPRCYYWMFGDCTSLTTAPILPAPTLAVSCYRQMFQGCTKLNSITCLATDITAENCTTNWLDNAGTDPSVTSKQFFTPSSTGWASPSVSGIPEGWTRVDTTP